MALYILRRTLSALVMILVLSSIVFLALYAVPGDPAVMLLSTGGVTPSPSAVASLRIQLGLDKPLLVQYWAFLIDLLHGDLGTSFSDNTPVMTTVLARLPRTLELIGGATVIALLVGLPLGVTGAVRQGEKVDKLLGTISTLGLSTPVFVLGSVFILVFSRFLHLAPAGGFVPFAQAPVQHLILLMMPACAIAVGLASVIFRMTRASVIGVLSRDWVRNARSNGLSEERVLWGHAVRNALAPVATVVGLQMGSLLGGTVLVEYVFNWPGLSGLLVGAIESRDYPEVRGTVLVIAIIFILLNLLVDLLYVLLDPRVRQ